MWRSQAYPSVFTACRDGGADWVTYRRAPLVAPTRLPLLAPTAPTAGAGGHPLVYADEPVQIGGYGTARQISWFHNGVVAMQVLIPDTAACPVALLRTLKSRWRIENAFKYASEFFGIDALADYLADIQTNTRPVDNPARKKASRPRLARRVCRDLQKRSAAPSAGGHARGRPGGRRRSCAGRCPGSLDLDMLVDDEQGFQPRLLLAGQQVGAGVQGQRVS